MRAEPNMLNYGEFPIHDSTDNKLVKISQIAEILTSGPALEREAGTWKKEEEEFGLFEHAFAKSWQTGRLRETPPVLSKLLLSRQAAMSEDPQQPSTSPLEAPTPTTSPTLSPSSSEPSLATTEDNFGWTSYIDIMDAVELEEDLIAHVDQTQAEPIGGIQQGT